MAMKVLDLRKQHERCIFTGTPRDEIRYAEAFWQSVRLQPTMESRLVSSDIKQRIGKRAASSKSGTSTEHCGSQSDKKLSELFIRARTLDQIEKFERLRRLADARIEDRNRLHQRREERINREQISRDKLIKPAKFEETANEKAQIKRDIGEAYSIAEMIREIDAFEKKKYEEWQRTEETVESALPLVRLKDKSSALLGMRTRDKIYINLRTDNACILNLNATHEVGCRSNRSGNVGVLHYIQSYDDYDWVLAEGPLAPYVALLNSADFNLSSLERLDASPRVTGILIIALMDQSSELSYPQLGFSSVDTCPNDAYGMYGNTSYAQCKKALWNRSGTSVRFRNIHLPVFELSDPHDVDAVLHKCFYAFNNKSKVYPACAAELTTEMEAAVDSVTCMRRSLNYERPLSAKKIFCDPLGDQNVVATMKPVESNETRYRRSVVMVATRLDATSIFHHAYQAADTAVSGIVTLLATAEALWKVRDIIRDNSAAKDIMFVFFQGETFDYIGSSRMVYDMEKQRFPCNSNERPDNLRNIELDHIDQLLEVNQVGHRSRGGFLWTHTDPLSEGYARSKILQMVTDLKMIGRRMNVNFASLSNNTPLPPASAQRLLLKKQIPAVVLTDHFETYTNKFYNSRFDTAFSMAADDYPRGLNADDKYDYVTQEARLLANLSSTLAQYLFKASTGKLAPAALVPQLTADPTTVTHLLYCFLVSPGCQLFAESVNSSQAKFLQQKTHPLSFYVGVADTLNNVTELVHNLMARFTGQLEQYSEAWCIHKRSKMYRHVWMQGGRGKTGKPIGWCFKTLVFYNEAKSPAFVIPDHDLRSGEYSTWTESRWDDNSIRVRLFLLPSKKYQIMNLFVGLILFILSLTAVYVCVRKSEDIFSAAPLPDDEDDMRVVQHYGLPG